MTRSSVRNSPTALACSGMWWIRTCTPAVSQARRSFSARCASVSDTPPTPAPPGTSASPARPSQRASCTTRAGVIFGTVGIATSAAPAELLTTSPPGAGLAPASEAPASPYPALSTHTPHTPVVFNAFVSDSHAHTHPALPTHTPHTPIVLQALEIELLAHPDPAFVAHLLDGLRYGFRVGYDGPRHSLLCENLASAFVSPEIVSAYLAKEVQLGHTAGPFWQPPFANFRSAGIGVIPKKSGGHRLIVHLSAPAGASINDGIPEDLYSLEYITVDVVVGHVIRHGKGALMYNVDIRHAFRNIPVHPHDWPLLGMVWDGQYYFDKVLPFELRSSPALFNLLADALCWILRHNYSLADLEHYLDDYIGVAPPSPSPSSSTAAIQQATLLTVFENLGVPVATGQDKVVPPTTVMTVLGIEVDSVEQATRLPPGQVVHPPHSSGNLAPVHRLLQA